MTALIVVLAIALFFTFVFSMPAVFYIDYKEELYVSVRYLFVKFRLIPESPSKKKKPEKIPQNEPEDKDNESAIKKLKDTAKKSGPGGFVEILVEIAKALGKGIRGVANHIVIYKLDIEIKCSCEDAAQTAINYGHMSAAVYPALSLILGEVKKCKSKNVQISPDYNNNSTSVNCHVVFKLKVWWVVLTSVKVLFKILKQFMKLKKM